MTSLRERFDEKVGPPDANGCWPWLGATAGEGYGHIRLGGRGEGTIRANRLALMWKLGRAIRPGYQACHTIECNNPACVNPEHLYEGTKLENEHDKIANGTVPRGERHGRALYSDAVVEEARRLHRELNLTATEIARTLGISQQHVSRILKGQTR